LDGPGFGPREAAAPRAGARAPTWTTHPRVSTEDRRLRRRRKVT